MIYRRFIVLLTLLFLVSCSSISSYKPVNKEGLLEEKEIKEQSKFLVRSLAEKSRKLHDIAWPIMKSNTDSCLNAKINAFGIMVSHIDDLPLSLNSSFYAASPENIENDDTILFPMIVSVANNSPAHRSQVMDGDLIIAINNNLVSKENYRALLDEAAIKGNLKITIKRQKKEILHNLTSEVICGYPVQAMISPIPNAYADGSKIYITIATFDFVKDDQELAFLIGHELAHNILHYKNFEANEANLLAIDYLDKPKIRQIKSILVWSNENREIEADIEGIHLAFKAGFSLENVNDYWRRLSVFNPELIKKSINIYKSNAYRAALINKTLKKLKEQADE